MLYRANKFWTSQTVLSFILCGTLALLVSLSSVRAQSVTLTWSPSTDPNVAGYVIYYGGSSHNYTNTTVVGNVTNVTISGLASGATYYFAATTYDAAGDESDFSNEATYVIPTAASNLTPVNQPPTLNPIASLTINENVSAQTVSLSGITSGSATENQALKVTATSSNTSLIPNPTVSYTSPNSTGSLSLKPAANATGTAIITVMVNDGGATNNLVTQTFSVTVNAVFTGNHQPTLNPIANLSVNQYTNAQTISLSGITSGATNENQILKVTAVSSNPTLIANPSISYTSPKTTGTLSFTPTGKTNGMAIITVTVNDGGKSNNIVTQTFAVTIIPGINPNAPKISKPVTSSVSLTGKTVSLSVAATGQAPLRYQWQFNGVNVSGATASTLTLKNVTAKQAGSYSVTVSNSSGATNSIASLAVVTAPTASLSAATRSNGKFSFLVSDQLNCKYIVQASTNLVNWVSVQTNTAPFNFVDNNAGNFSQRYYRTVYVP